MSRLAIQCIFPSQDTSVGISCQNPSAKANLVQFCTIAGSAFKATDVLASQRGMLVGWSLLKLRETFGYGQKRRFLD